MNYVMCYAVESVHVCHRDWNLCCRTGTQLIVLKMYQTNASPLKLLCFLPTKFWIAVCHGLGSTQFNN